MHPELVPLSLGDLLDEAFDLYKANAALFAGTVAVVHLPTQVALAWAASRLGLRGPVADAPDQASLMLGEAGVWIILGLLATLAFIAQQGALTLAVSDRYLGRPASLGSTYRRLLPHVIPLEVTGLLVACAVGAGAVLLLFALVLGLGLMAALLPGAGTVGPAGATSVGLGIVAVWLGGVLIVYAALGACVTQVVVIERTGLLGAVQRNTVLVSHRFWRVVAACTVLVVATLGMLTTAQASVTWLLDLVLYSWLPVSAMTRWVAEQAWRGVVWTMLQPYWMVVLTLLYYDQRVRTEGFDISLLEAQVLQPAGPDRP